VRPFFVEMRALLRLGPPLIGLFVIGTLVCAAALTLLEASPNVPAVFPFVPILSAAVATAVAYRWFGLAASQAPVPASTSLFILSTLAMATAVLIATMHPLAENLVAELREVRATAAPVRPEPIAADPGTDSPILRPQRVGRIEPATVIAISSGGRYVATALKTTPGGGFGVAVREGLSTSRLVLPHSVPITALAFDPRGTMLAVGQVDGEITFWELLSPLAVPSTLIVEPRGSVQAHRAPVDFLTFAADSISLASWSRAEHAATVVRFGDWTSGQWFSLDAPVTRIPYPSTRDPKKVQPWPALAPDGSLVALPDGALVRGFQVPSGREVLSVNVGGYAE
jgi:hypothetical protein